MQQSNLPQSTHFELQQIAAGTYTAIAKYGGWAVSNSGLFDLGHETLVFDTLLTPRAAKDLRLFSEYLFRRSPALVINSHYHNDHIWGNQAFLPGAHIISTDQTRRLIQAEGDQRLKHYAAQKERQLADVQQEYEGVSEDHKAPLEERIQFYQGLIDELAHLELCLPTITFNNRMNINGSNGEAHLISFAGAHTASDTVLFLPQQSVVFMSDLLFIGHHPYLPDGDPELWLMALKEVSKMDAEFFVPGHGPVGTLAHLEQMAGYIEHCVQMARTLANDGMASDEYVELVSVPDEYAAWERPDLYYDNLRFTCRRLVNAG